MADQQSNLQIIIRTVKQGTGDAEAQKGLGNLKGELGDLSQGLLGTNLASVGLTAGLVMAGKGALDLAYKGGEAEASLTRLDAVLKSTNGSAGMTMNQLTNLSQGIMFLTGIEDEEVQSAEAVLLTFRNMSEDIFPRVIQGAADLSAVFGMDLQSATMMLAKALSAPDEGLMALERSTGKLDQAVKDNIKSLMDQGKTFEAQNLLMGEVEKRVGGAAAAMGNTYPGQVKKLQTAISELGEAFGKTLVPYISKATDALITLLTWNDKLKLALSVHSEEVSKTSKSYADYWKEMIRAYDASKGVTISQDQLTHAMLTLPLDETAKKFGFLTQAEWDAAQATKENTGATEAQMTADEEAALAKEKLARALSDSNEAVKYATGYAKEFGSYEKNLADAEAQLQDDRKAGWKDVSQKIKDDKQAIADLQAAHKTALDQMIVDLFTYKLEQDKDLSPEDVEKKALDLQLAFGLITQAEYDSTLQSLDLATALLGLPTGSSTYSYITWFKTYYETYGDSGGKPQTGQGNATDWLNGQGGGGGGGQTGINPATGRPYGAQTGLDFTVPPGFEGDNYPLNLRVKSGERVKVETPDQQNMQGGGGGGNNGPLVGTVNNYNIWDREAASAWLRSMT